MTQTERRYAHHPARTAAPRLAPPSTVSTPGAEEKAWTLGIAEIDARLPNAGLRPGAVHEVIGEGHRDGPAAAGFAVSLLHRLAATPHAASGPRTILWCQPRRSEQEVGRIYGPGLQAFGFAATSFLFAKGARNRDVLWAIEEGARSGALLAVVGAVETVSFTESRRLALAASVGGTPVLLLRADHDRIASAAETRWSVSAAHGTASRFAPEAPGCTAWQLGLQKCRGGHPGAWHVEWDHEAYRFALVDRVSSRLSEVPRPSGGTVVPFRAAG